MIDLSHSTQRTFLSSVPAACAAAAPSPVGAALSEFARPTLNDLIARHERAKVDCDETFETMHAIEKRVLSEMDFSSRLVPHSMMDDGTNVARSYSELTIYENEFDEFSDRAHDELRERLCQNWMRSAMPEQYAAISSALDRSRARVGQLFAERKAELEQRKDETGLPAAQARFKAAGVAEVLARIAILTHQPVDAVEAQRKAEYLDAEDLIDDEEFTRALIGYFMAQVA